MSTLNRHIKDEGFLTIASQQLASEKDLFNMCCAVLQHVLTLCSIRCQVLIYVHNCVTLSVDSLASGSGSTQFMMWKWPVWPWSPLTCLFLQFTPPSLLTGVLENLSFQVSKPCGWSGVKSFCMRRTKVLLNAGGFEKLQGLIFFSHQRVVSSQAKITT